MARYADALFFLQRVLERSFSIRFKASAPEETDIALTLSVSLPITYVDLLLISSRF